MVPRIENLSPKLLVGQRIETSLSNDKTYELWSSFMPRRKEIKNNLNSDLISIQIFNSNLNLKEFTEDTKFEKWAAVEVSEDGVPPKGMDIIILQGGLYAVFLHKGPASSGPESFQYIFREWLPASEYTLDSRPQFAVMGEKYKNEEPDSEEEIWIPIKLKS